MYTPFIEAKAKRGHFPFNRITNHLNSRVSEGELPEHMWRNKNNVAGLGK